MVFFLLLIAIGYLVFTSFIFYINLGDFKPLLPATKNLDALKTPLVSVCIPARNEEKVVERAICSVLRQDYITVEVLVLDDQSTDATPRILNKLKEKHPEKLSILKGKPKPDNWLGKSWACHQLSKKANGDILFFIDADTWIEPQAIARAILSINHYSLDFLTVWPLQKLDTFWEKVVIPLVYYGLLSLLPARYVHQKPLWLPSFLERRFVPYFSAACGQCMVFRREAYQQIGGHQSVKDNIVEDVALAKRVKQEGLKMRMFHGKGVIACRMYFSGRAMWQGFRKNFLALFGNSIFYFLLMASINFIVYIFPFIIFFIGLFYMHLWYMMLSIISILIIYIHRLILARWYHWSKSMTIFHPLGVLWFLGLGIQVLKDYWTGTGPSWKNRSTSS